MVALLIVAFLAAVPSEGDIDRELREPSFEPSRHRPASTMTL